MPALFKKSVCALLSVLLSLLILTAAVFALLQLTPGDPLQSFYGDPAATLTQEERAQAMAQLGLDRPLYAQYLSWLMGLTQGQWGFSLIYRQQIAALLPPLLTNTLILGCVSYVLMFAAAIALALICVRWEGRMIDNIICSVGTCCCFLPSFWLGVILILIFAVNLQWLPSSGAYDPGQDSSVLNRLEHLILPAAVMVIGHVWYYGYLIRNRLLNEVREIYVLTAKAAGRTPLNILVTQCLRAMLPFLFNLAAVSVPHIISGTYIAEAVFNYPGIGAAAVESAKGQDYQLLLAVVLISGAVVIASAAMARLLSAHFDPRQRLVKGDLWQR